MNQLQNEIGRPEFLKQRLIPIFQNVKFRGDEFDKFINQLAEVISTNLKEQAMPTRNKKDPETLDKMLVLLKRLRGLNSQLSSISKLGVALTYEAQRTKTPLEDVINSRILTTDYERELGLIIDTIKMATDDEPITKRKAGRVSKVHETLLYDVTILYSSYFPRRKISSSPTSIYFKMIGSICADIYRIKDPTVTIKSFVKDWQSGTFCQ